MLKDPIKCIIVAFIFVQFIVEIPLTVLLLLGKISVNDFIGYSLCAFAINLGYTLLEVARL